MEFNKYKLRHRCFDYNLEKNARAIFLRATLQSCFYSFFNARLMLRHLFELNFVMIPFLLSARYLCAWILKSVVNTPAEEHSRPS